MKRLRALKMDPGDRAFIVSELESCVTAVGEMLALKGK